MYSITKKMKSSKILASATYTYDLDVHGPIFNFRCIFFISAQRAQVVQSICKALRGNTHEPIAQNNPLLLY